MRSDVIIDTAALPPNTAGKSASKKKKTTDMDDLHYVDYAELGNFILKKMNTKTLNRLWRHLDEDAQGHIEKEEVLNILQFTAVLYVAFRFKVQCFFVYGENTPYFNIHLHFYHKCIHDEYDVHLFTCVFVSFSLCAFVAKGWEWTASYK